MYGCMLGKHYALQQCLINTCFKGPVNELGIGDGGLRDLGIVKVGCIYKAVFNLNVLSCKMILTVDQLSIKINVKRIKCDYIYIR